jgi:hypothetical protein
MGANGGVGQLWHGGAPGRAAGEWLLPPSETGIASQVRAASVAQGRIEIGQRDDRVYVTTDRRLARAWAGIWMIDGENPGSGTLYQVQVDPSHLEPDDDFLSLSGRFFQIPRAQVSLVYDPYVRFQDKFHRELERVLTELAHAKLARSTDDPSPAASNQDLLGSAFETDR